MATQSFISKASARDLRSAKNPKADMITHRTAPSILNNIELVEKFKEVEGLPDTTKDVVLKLFGEFTSFEGIKEYVGKQPFPISGGALDNIMMIRMLCESPASRYKIMYFRNRYLNRIKEIAITHKRVRVDDLQYLRDRFVSQIKMLDDSKMEDVKEFRYMAKGLSEILSQAQEEIEGKGININVGVGVFGMEDIDGKSDEELISRRQELIARASRAVGFTDSGRPAIPHDGLGGSGGQRTAGIDGNPAGTIEAKVE